MPYLKFDNPSGTSSNKGSCGTFVNYLTKEDFMENPLSKEFFFNQNSVEVLNHEVTEAIDGNRKGLGKNDAKFYTGSINFSEEELQFIGNDPNKIKLYSIKVMEQYAAQFNRGITIDNINWFGKVEFKRYYKGDDDSVKRGLIDQGKVKHGLNTHVHFLVGRKSKDQKLKLSPKTNHRDTQKGPIKGGFNRDEYKMQCERIFDDMFGYLRPLEESYQYYKIQANGSVDEKVILSNQHANEKVKKESYLSQSIDKKENRISKLANFICHGADKGNIKQINIEAIIKFEQATGHNGYIYRSLVNLNRMIKLGKTPPEYDLTDKVLGYAKYLEFKGNNLSPSNIHFKNSAINKNLDQSYLNVKVLPSNNVKQKKLAKKISGVIPFNLKWKNLGFDWIEGWE